MNAFQMHRKVGGDYTSRCVVYHYNHNMKNEV